MPLCLVIPYLVLVLFPNILIRFFSPKAALSQSELLIIFAMGLIAAMIPDWGMIRYLISVITAPHYFASAENQWEAHFFAYLPEWVVLPNDRNQVSYFFSGKPLGASIPWQDWIIPLFWWMSVFGVLFFIGACLVVIFRKQWVENERLRFPMGEVIIQLLETKGNNRDRFPELFGKPMFRIGAVVSFSVMTWNIVGFWDIVPHIPLPGPVFNIVIDPAFPPIPIRLVPYVLCFAFFVNVEILFSIVFFQIIGIVETGVLNRFGVISPASTIVPGGLVSIQFCGGLIMFSLIGCWMARAHLRNVLRKALGKQSTLNDEDELFSYRIAVFGLILGLIFMMAWLTSIGFSIVVSVLFLCFLLIFYFGIGRVLAEAGLINLDLPINAHAFTVGMVGSANLSGSTLTGLGLTNAFARNWRTFTMIGLSHVAWWRDYLSKNRGNLFLLLCLAFLGATIISTGYVIYTGYSQGADNLYIPLRNTGNLFFDLVVNWMKNATQISTLEILFLTLGLGVSSFLALGRYLFYWWPLNPIGFAIGASGPIRGIVFTLFVAWVVQVILLRIGGVNLYRKVQPLFLGMLVGYVIGIFVAYIVDSIYFPDVPHIAELF